MEERLATVSEVEGRFGIRKDSGAFSNLPIGRFFEFETNRQKGPQGMSMTETTK
jgi:hypothetical protein